MEECEEIEERGVQRDHPPAPEKTFRGRWMISGRKRTARRRAAAVAPAKKELKTKTKGRFSFQLPFYRNIPASQVCPFLRRHDKKATLKTQSSFSMFLIQLSSFNPAGLQAACANVHSPCTTVDFTFNASDVGIPDTVGSSMGMAYVVTEMSAFATNIAFCHDCTSSNYIRRLTDNISMITELNTFGK